MMGDIFAYRGRQVTIDDLERLYTKIKRFVSIIDDLNLTVRIWSKE